MKCNRLLIISFLLLAICSFFGCSSVKVLEVDQLSGAKSGDYQYFNFYKLDIENNTALEPQKENLELLLTEVRDAMEARGLKRSENPELMINIGIVINEEVQTRQTSIDEAPMYMGQRNYHWESEEVVVGTYNEGTVAIDFVDTEKNKLAYHAVAQSVLSKKQEKNREKIKQAVDKIFSKLKF